MTEMDVNVCIPAGSPDVSQSVENDENNADDKTPAHVSDFVKMITIPSDILHMAVAIAAGMLASIGVAKPLITVINSVASIFFVHDKQRCNIVMRHHSPKSVLVYLCQNDALVGRMFMWAPLEFQWHILHLAAVYFRMKRALLRLHKITDLYCVLDENTRVCLFCGKLGGFYAPSKKRVIFKLDVQYAGD